MVLTSDGNVGVGVPAPTRKFEVLGSAAITGGDFEFRDGGITDTTAVRIISYGGNLYLQNGSGGNIFFRNILGVTVNVATLSNSALAYQFISDGNGSYISAELV